LARQAATARVWGHAMPWPIKLHGVPQSDVPEERIAYWQVQYALEGSKLLCPAAPRLSDLFSQKELDDLDAAE